MREEIVSFIREEGRQYPFFIEMTGVSWCDGSYRIARTGSPVMVVEYVLRGRGTVTTGERTFTAAQGDVYLLHKGSNHRYGSDSADPWVKVWMNVDGPLVESLVADYGLGGVNHAPCLDIEGLLTEVFEMAKSGRENPDGLFLEAAVLFHRILARIYGHTRREGDGRPPEASEMKAWLDRHIYGRTNMRETAARIFRSPSQANRIFRREYGVTPADYLLGRKIETAKLLLRNTNMPVKEVAYRLVFADEHYFSNCFKKRVGVAPGEYRSGSSGR